MIRDRVGFTCAYTPLPLIHAAGFTPYRVLPHLDVPDRSGSYLHESLCPHVKRVLDRALDGGLPEMSGVVFMNSCDAMRRLADAWLVAWPGDRMILLDLPTTVDGNALTYFAQEMSRFVDRLSSWAGRPTANDEIIRAVRLYNDVAGGLIELRERAALAGGWRTFQEILNRSVTESPDETLKEIRSLLQTVPQDSSVPPNGVFLFGNVLSDPQAFELIESCGARLVVDDLCTGSRQIAPIDIDESADVLPQIAKGILSRPACARTIDTANPVAVAERVLTEATACGARGVIAHVMKFCDPYLSRLPTIHHVLRKAGIPLLILEGDCTLRSLGQHRTRIEAFVETLGEIRS